MTAIPLLAAKLTNEGVCRFLFGEFDPHLAVGLRYLHVMDNVAVYKTFHTDI